MNKTILRRDEGKSTQARLFILIGLIFLISYFLLWALNQNGVFEFFAGQDSISGFLQGTLGVAVSLAGAWVAISIARNGESLAKTAITLAEATNRREAYQEVSSAVEKIQTKLTSLATSVRNLVGACQPDRELEEILDVYTLDIIIRNAVINRGDAVASFDPDAPTVETQAYARELTSSTAEYIEMLEEATQTGQIKDDFAIQKRRRFEAAAEALHLGRANALDMQEKSERRLKVICNEMRAVSESILDILASHQYLGLMLGRETESSDSAGFITIRTAQKLHRALSLAASKLDSPGTDTIEFISRATLAGVFAFKDSALTSWANRNTDYRAIAMIGYLIHMEITLDEEDLVGFNSSLTALTTIVDLFPSKDDYDTFFKGVSKHIGVGTEDGTEGEYLPTLLQRGISLNSAELQLGTGITSSLKAFVREMETNPNDGPRILCRTDPELSPDEDQAYPAFRSLLRSAIIARWEL
jgi:hypothetical protein